MKSWEMFINKSNKTEFETEFATLLQDIMSEGLARIDQLSDEELEKQLLRRIRLGQRNDLDCRND